MRIPSRMEFSERTGSREGAPVVYPDHSDEEGHRYRLADAF